MSVLSLTTPQCGQTGPSGQRIASRCSRALSASVKIGRVKFVIGLSNDDNLGVDTYYVKYIIPPTRGRLSEHSTAPSRRCTSAEPAPSLPTRSIRGLRGYAPGSPHTARGARGYSARGWGGSC